LGSEGNDAHANASCLRTADNQQPARQSKKTSDRAKATASCAKRRIAKIYQGTATGSQPSGPIGDRDSPTGLGIEIQNLAIGFGQLGGDRRSERAPNDLPKPCAINISHKCRP
jgi:hypothetical protein